MLFIKQGYTPSLKLRDIDIERSLTQRISYKVNPVSTGESLVNEKRRDVAYPTFPKAKPHQVSKVGKRRDVGYMTSLKREPGQVSKVGKR
ncbi:MAG: hypothetical protein DDT29_02483 [Dehalococcoidia bacterium]|nr:hypothetical protein [Bacillota bacterium]